MLSHQQYDLRSWHDFASQQDLASPADSVIAAALAKDIMQGKDPKAWTKEYVERQVGSEEFSRFFDQNMSREGMSTPGFVRNWSAELQNSLLTFLASKLDKPYDLFAELLIAASDRERLKSLGAIYTPEWLAGRLTRSARGYWKRHHEAGRHGRKPALIGDISCGIGVFLKKAREEFGVDPAIVGIDKDPRALAFARLLQHATNSDYCLIQADALLTVFSGEGLFPNHELALQSFDLLIGNPPYVRSQQLDRNYSKQLRQKHSDVLEGNFDLAIAFLDRTLDLLAPGGIASYILTNKFMSSTYGKAIRTKLATTAQIINIEDFFDLQLFPGRTTYTCILTFAKLPPAKKFTVTRFPRQTKAETLPSQGETLSLDSRLLLNHPWELISDVERQILSKLQSNKHRFLLDVFDNIVQGVRTGANSVFVVPTAESQHLEMPLLVPFIQGESIRRMRCDSDQFRLIFPYKTSPSGGVKPFTQEELSKNYPQIWQYLEERQEILQERASDAKSGWHLYSRSQNLTVPFMRKLFVREMMPRAEFAADFRGEIAFASGYALTTSKLADDSLMAWQAIMSTPTVEYALRQIGTQLHSGWFRLLKHHLERVRVPVFSDRTFREIICVSEKLNNTPDDIQLWRVLDDLVARAYGLADTDREAIYKYLLGQHEKSLTETTNNQYEPVKLHRYNLIHVDRSDLRKEVTFQSNKKLPIHRWYSFTQGFSEQLVNEILDAFGATSHDIVLDPFVGSGTTVLASRKRGIPSIGVELSPFMAWVSATKSAVWDVAEIEQAVEELARIRLPQGKPTNLLFSEFFEKAYSHAILTHLLGFRAFLDQLTPTDQVTAFLKMGYVSVLEQLSQIRKHGSHYRYMLNSGSVGLQKLNIQLADPDTDVQSVIVDKLREMISDVKTCPLDASTDCSVVVGDARALSLHDQSVDYVITSPPYLNRNNYIAQQKAEMVLLGTLSSYKEYRSLVRSTFRSHVEAQYSVEPVTRFPQVRKILDAITLSARNNSRIPHMIAGYFEDLDASIREISRVMRSGGRCALVVGNSRWGGVVVPVDHIALMIAEQYGFEPVQIMVTRLKGNSPQQMRQYGRIPVRESIVIFHKR